MATKSCSCHLGKSDLLCSFSNFGMSGSCHTSPSVLNRLSWYNVSPHEYTEYVWSQVTHSHRSIGLLAEMEGSVVYCSLYWASLCGTLAHRIHLCNLACHHIWYQKKIFWKSRVLWDRCDYLPFVHVHTVAITAGELLHWAGGEAPYGCVWSTAQHGIITDCPLLRPQHWTCARDCLKSWSDWTCCNPLMILVVITKIKCCAI